MTQENHLTNPIAFAGTNTNDSVVLDLLQTIKKTNRDNIAVLDLGAGQGYNAWKLKSLAQNSRLSITCTDIDSNEFKLAQDDNLRFVEFNLNNKFDFGKFDFIFATEIIEHLENPYGFLNNCVANLKDGGTLYVTTPNVAAIYSVIKILLTGVPFLFGDMDEYGHRMPFFPFMLKRAAVAYERATGKKMQIETWYNKNTLRLYPTRKTLKVFGNHSRLLGESAIYKITIGQ